MKSARNGNGWLPPFSPRPARPLPVPAPPAGSPSHKLAFEANRLHIGLGWGGAFPPSRAAPPQLPRAPHIDPAVAGRLINSLNASVWRRMCQHRCIHAVAISTTVRYLDVDIPTSVSQHRSDTSISVSKHLYLGVGISTSSRTSTSLLRVAPPTKNGHAPPPRQ